MSAEVAEKLRGHFVLTHRGAVEIKGKGVLDTYFLIGDTADTPMAVVSQP